MAIKIKRDVNAAAAAYGSMVGGKGKRQSEDAKILASLQRSGGAGGGGTGGGARAGADASLISAPSGGGGAQLGSVGGLVSPSRSGGGVSGVSSPGGRKKGYLGSTSARATMTDKDYGMYSLQQGGSAKRPTYNLLDNEGNVVRSYSQAQWDHLQKRGHSNSTMDRVDSAAFFRSQGGQTAEEKAAAIRQGEQEFRASEAQKSRDAQAASQQKQQEWSSAEKQKDREAQAEARNAEQKWRAAEAEKERQAKLDAERRAQQRRSYAEQGYSQEQILMLEDNDRKKLEIETDPNASINQQELALIELEDERKKIGDPLNPRKTPQEEYNDSIIVDEKTGIRYRKNSRGDFERVEDAPAGKKSAQEIWDGAFVAPNGTRYIVDGRGGIVPIADPRAKVAEEAQRRRSEYILEKLQEKKENWDSKKNGAFDPQKIAKEIAAEYDAAYGGSSPTATPAPKSDGAAPATDGIRPLPATAEEMKNKFRKVKKDEDNLY
jgi:hypothetical protein